MRKIALSGEPTRYADSSALVKLVISEPESDALRAYLSQVSVLVTSRLATVEVSRATALANPDQSTLAAVDRLLSTCVLVSVSAQLLHDARRLTSASVRTLDAIHLASAITVDADEFVAYDKRLLDAALALGMAVATPGR